LLQGANEVAVDNARAKGRAGSIDELPGVPVAQAERLTNHAAQGHIVDVFVVQNIQIARDRARAQTAKGAARLGKRRE
jgi:hypothetical protein